MGIPSYFSNMVRSYRGVIKEINEASKQIDNLYLDSNSVIYDCVRSIEYEGNDELFERELIEKICETLDTLITSIGPQRTIIAFDGVAPVAKLEQQRNRRFKRWLESEICKDQLTTWPTASITPGTKFMADLAKGVKSYFKKWKTPYVIVSSSEEPGEGEHKIFQFIRENSIEHKHQTTVIYGLDADLIMLTLNHLHISESMYLYRETPHFIRSIDKSLDPEKLYCIDIPELAASITEEMKCGSREKIDTHRVHDYILLCFLLGNDFMPHFPCINIRTDGTETLLEVYRATVGAHGKYITDGDTIEWPIFRLLIKELASRELELYKSEYAKRAKMQRITKLGRPGANTINDKIQNLPIVRRDEEIYIAPSETDSAWTIRYYDTLFKIGGSYGAPEKIAKRKGQICSRYLEALQWTYLYYRKGCVDWRWSYPYHYAPLLQDLYIYTPQSQCNMVETNTDSPIPPATQLAYVLPQAYHERLLGKQIAKQLQREIPECYSESWKMQWAFCRYFWESHAEMRPFDISKLEKITQSREKCL